MRWCVVTLVLAACRFDSSSGGSGNAEIGESSGTSTPTTNTTSSTTVTTTTPDDTTGASTDAESTSPPATETTATPTSTESSSTGPNVAPFEVGPFDEAIELSALNSSMAHDDDPTLRSDLLEIYFATGRRGSEEIFRSERNSVDDDWDPPDIVEAFNTPDSETTPELSRDGLTMVLATQTAVTEVDLYFSTRASVDSVDWSNLQPISELNTGIGDLGLVLTEDLFTGYFCRRDLPDTDLYRATRTRTDGVFEEIEIAMPFGTDAYECNPWIEPGGTIIVFGGGPTQDERDLQWAELNGDDFDPAQTLDIVSTADPEDDPWVTDDGGVIFFSRTVGKLQDLYWAQRP